MEYILKVNRHRNYLAKPRKLKGLKCLEETLMTILNVKLLWH